MDMASTAILGAARLFRDGAGQGATPLTDIPAGDAGLSFKSVMTDIMSSSSVENNGAAADSSVNPAAGLVTDKSDADENPMAELSIGSVTGRILSVGNETALKYFMGTYLSSKENIQSDGNVFSALIDESESGDYSDIWDKLMSVLSASDIADMTAFSAEMETFLFTGETRNGKEKGLGSSIVDVFDDMDLRIMAAKAKKDPAQEVNSILASLAASSQMAADIIPAVTPDSYEALGEEDAAALTALLENADDETIRDLAKELTAVFSSKLDQVAAEKNVTESFVNYLRATADSIASYDAEKTVLEDVTEKLRALFKGNAQTDIPDVDVTVSETKTDDMSSRLEAMRSAGQAKIRTADNSESANAVPKIVSPSKSGESTKGQTDFLKDESSSDAALTAETQKIAQETILTDNSEDIPKSSEELNFKTMEQVISEIEKAFANHDKGTKELTIKLRPETLGEITVKIAKSTEGTLEISLAAQNRDVAELLKDHSAELANALSDKGADVRSVNIVEASQANQNLQFGMNGEQGFNFYRNAAQNSGSHTGGGNPDSDDEEDIAVSSVNDTEDIINSREAKLWQKI